MSLRVKAKLTNDLKFVHFCEFSSRQTISVAMLEEACERTKKWAVAKEITGKSYKTNRKERVNSEYSILYRLLPNRADIHTVQTLKTRHCDVSFADT